MIEGFTDRKIFLYHVTSEDSANSIWKLRAMIPGSSGYFGAGIYFGENEQESLAKAHYKGATIVCEVKVGKTLVL